MTSFEAGDIVWIEFDPVLGTEQGGRRPAIVLTNQNFNDRDKRSIVCPITSNVAPWPTKVILPPGMRTAGAVLVDQIRSLSRDHRGSRFIEHAPDDVLKEVKAVLGALLQIG